MEVLIIFRASQPILLSYNNGVILEIIFIIELFAAGFASSLIDVLCRKAHSSALEPVRSKRTLGTIKSVELQECPPMFRKHLRRNSCLFSRYEALKDLKYFDIEYPIVASVSKENIEKNINSHKLIKKILIDGTRHKEKQIEIPKHIKVNSKVYDLKALVPKESESLSVEENLETFLFTLKNSTKSTQNCTCNLPEDDSSDDEGCGEDNDGDEDDEGEDEEDKSCSSDEDADFLTHHRRQRRRRGGGGGGGGDGGDGPPGGPPGGKRKKKNRNKNKDRDDDQAGGDGPPPPRP